MELNHLQFAFKIFGKNERRAPINKKGVKRKQILDWSTANLFHKIMPIVIPSFHFVLPNYLQVEVE